MRLIHLSALSLLLEACDETCSACTNGFECSSCRTSLLMRNGQCVTSCGKGYFQEQQLCIGNSKQKQNKITMPCGSKRADKAAPERLESPPAEGSAVDIGVNDQPKVKGEVNRVTQCKSGEILIKIPQRIRPVGINPSAFEHGWKTAVLQQRKETRAPSGAIKLKRGTQSKRTHRLKCQTTFYFVWVRFPLSTGSWCSSWLCLLLLEWGERPMLPLIAALDVTDCTFRPDSHTGSKLKSCWENLFLFRPGN